jgi:hypothetical protein
LACPTTVRASGAKYAALADVPGFRTSTFLALRGPILSTPTLSYLDGVSGASNPFIRSKLTDAFDIAGGADAASAASTATTSTTTFERTSLLPWNEAVSIVT